MEPLLTKYFGGCQLRVGRWVFLNKMWCCEGALVDRQGYQCIFLLWVAGRDQHPPLENVLLGLTVPAYPGSVRKGKAVYRVGTVVHPAGIKLFEQPRPRIWTCQQNYSYNFFSAFNSLQRTCLEHLKRCRYVVVGCMVFEELLKTALGHPPRHLVQITMTIEVMRKASPI